MRDAAMNPHHGALVIGHLDDDLAVLARREAALEGRGCLCECECRVDRNAKLAAIYEFRELDQLRPVRFNYEVGPCPGGSAATETRRPPLASSAGARTRNSPPTVSKMRSTASSSSSNCPLRPSTTSCAPSARAAWNASGEAVAMTWAPRQRPSCVAN